MKKLLCIILLIAVAVLSVSCADSETADTDSDTSKSTASSDASSIGSTEDSLDFRPIDDTTEAVVTTAEEVTEAAPAETPAETVPQEETQPAEQPAEQPVQPNPTPAPVINPGTYTNDPLIGRMTFLGDSTTYGLKYYGVVADSQVWTPSNGTLAIFRATTDYIYDPVTGGEYSVGTMCSMYTPDILVITLGVNGISFMDEANFKSSYNALIDVIKAASPSTKIALQTMYPLASNYDTSTGITNEKISAGNVWIQQIAANYGIACINSAPSLVDSSGFRPLEWQNGDGLHMSAAGFGAVMNYIVSNPCY